MLQQHNDKAIQGIITPHAELFYISPHLDDALFSAGSLLLELRAYHPITVITVFTEAGMAPETLSARRFTRNCGYRSSQKLYQDRRAEDAGIWNDLHISFRHLGFVDALWRKRDVTSGFTSILGGVIPELLHRYPIYRRHITSGKLHRDDERLVAAVVKSLRAVIPSNAIIMCPMGLGNHIDHLITKLACGYLNMPTWYWADFPYVLNTPIDAGVSVAPRQSSVIIQHDAYIRRKAYLARRYVTQFMAVFPNNTMPLVPEQFIITSV